MTFDTEKANPKKHSFDTHRICSAEETLERITPVMKQFGITRVANITGLDRIGIPVTIAIRPNSKSVSVSQGKGRTLADAKVSAIMESIEIWHAENFKAPVLYGRGKDLRSRHAFANLTAIPRPVGSTYSEYEPCLWVSAIELNTNTEKLVPYEMIHADYTYPTQPAHGFFPASTNGLSSGNHILEATCHAITEVIERDALSVWDMLSDEHQALRRVDLSSIDDAACSECLSLIVDAGLQCGVWDITTDTEVPCYLSLIHEPKDKTNHMGLGSGCHPDRNIALRRALTEAAQTRLNYISGARDDLHFLEFTQDGIDAKRSYSIGMLGKEAASHQYKVQPVRQYGTVEEDLRWLLDKLNLLGINEVISVDMSHHEHRIPVVRVIIPGLEAPHDDSSYTPGPRAERAAQIYGFAS